MLRHVVLFELSADAPAGAAGAIATALRGLPERIPGILSYEVSVDLGLRPGNAQVGLVAGFEDEAAWRAYVAHPEHQAVLDDVILPVPHRRLGLQAEVAGR